MMAVKKFNEGAGFARKNSVAAQSEPGQLQEKRAQDDSAGAVVLVEGFFDCMKVTQAEVPCVALIGCSLSNDQEVQLVQNFERVIVMLDGDEAGCRSAPEIVSRLAGSLFVRMVDVGDLNQPDQLSTEEIKSLLSGLL